LEYVVGALAQIVVRSYLDSNEVWFTETQVSNMSGRKAMIATTVSIPAILELTDQTAYS